MHRQIFFRFPFCVCGCSKVDLDSTKCSQGCVFERNLVLKRRLVFKRSLVFKRRLMFKRSICVD